MQNDAEGVHVAFLCALHRMAKFGGAQQLGRRPQIAFPLKNFQKKNFLTSRKSLNFQKKTLFYHELRGIPLLAITDFVQPKIRDLQCPARRDQTVSGFEVAVHFHVRLMQINHTLLGKFLEFSKNF